MALIPSQSLVHVHADHIKEADAAHQHVQIQEPEPDDAAARPDLFEALEQALWQGPQADGAGAEGREAQLAPGLDVAEVLHPVAGITLDV